MRDLWQWEQETFRPELFAPPPARRPTAAWGRTAFTAAASLPARLGRTARLAGIAGIVVILAAGMVFDPGTGRLQVGHRRKALETLLVAREGELRHVRIEADRYRLILAQSTRYGIPGDLAASIHDIAVQEDIPPTLAFALVRVESGFMADAVSEAGAVGLTQLMPATAVMLQPGVTRAELFQRETNLRLGFRYLRRLLRQYEGDLRLALLAYNRGPTRVDELRSRGEDPGNGYARSVMSRASQ